MQARWDVCAGMKILNKFIHYFYIPLIISEWSSSKFVLDIPDHPYLISLMAVHQFLTFSSFLVWEWTEWEEGEEWLEWEDVDEGVDEE